LFIFLVTTRKDSRGSGALSAIKYDPQLKEYYLNKKEEGKNGMLVLNNIRCKIISRVFSVVNRQTPFINTYKFAS
jgi:hypothetical protein